MQEKHAKPSCQRKKPWASTRKAFNFSRWHAALGSDSMLKNRPVWERAMMEGMSISTMMATQSSSGKLGRHASEWSLVVVAMFVLCMSFQWAPWKEDTVLRCEEPGDGTKRNLVMEQRESVSGTRRTWRRNKERARL